MIADLKELGALIESTDAFWTERAQLQVTLHPINGTARTMSDGDDISASQGGLDASTFRTAAHGSLWPQMHGHSKRIGSIVQSLR